MNVLRISLRSLRVRALGSVLTTVSVALGAGLVAALWLMIDQTEKRFTQSWAGFDAVVGPKEGSPLTLVLSTVLNLGGQTGLVPMSVYDELRTGRLARRYGIRYAIPQARGDTFGGFPIVGTTDGMFHEFARGFDEVDGTQVPRRLELAAGEFWSFGPDEFVAFAREKTEELRHEFEHSSSDGHDHDHHHEALPEAWRKAVVGAIVAESLGLGVGSTFVPVHGQDARTAHHHDEAETEVVGVLKRTGTPLDRVIWVPISLFLSLEGHEPVVRKPEDLEKDVVQLTGIVVSPRHPVGGEWLRSEFQTRDDAQAAVPRQQITELLSVIGNVAAVLRVIAWLVVAVAAIGVCVALYNTMHERRRDIAIMRSLGASRTQIMTIIVAEALVISAAGAVLGILLCHAAAFGFADRIAAETGVTVDWAAFSVREAWLILGVTLIGGIAGAVPAIKGSTTEVAENLGPAT